MESCQYLIDWYLLECQKRNGCLCAHCKRVGAGAAGAVATPGAAAVRGVKAVRAVVAADTVGSAPVVQEVRHAWFAPSAVAAVETEEPERKVSTSPLCEYDENKEMGAGGFGGSGGRLRWGVGDSRAECGGYAENYGYPREERVSGSTLLFFCIWWPTYDTRHVARSKDDPPSLCHLRCLNEGATPPAAGLFKHRHARCGRRVVPEKDEGG